MVKQHLFLVAKFTQHKIYHCDHYKVFESMHLVDSHRGPVSTSTSSKIFSSPEEETLYLVAVTLHFLLHPPATGSISTDLPILHISYTWNYTIYDILYPVPVTQHNVFKVHSCCSMYQCFIPFYDPIIFLVMAIPHLFIHSSVNGYLSCFPNIQLLAIVDSATAESHVEVFCLNTYFQVFVHTQA